MVTPTLNLFTQPANTQGARFKNEHLSVSRLRLFEQCELAFFYHYVAKIDGERPRVQAADFGKVLHSALEDVYRWIIENEYVGTFPIDRLVAAYRQAWVLSNLSGVALYQEGLGLLRIYAKNNNHVDHMKILAVEEEFNVEFEGFLFNGLMDRVEKTADDAVEVIDYKSNRLIYTQSELATDLQMSLYGYVVRKLYPWAKRVTYRFDMLRHGFSQKAERKDEDIAEAMEYLVTLGRRSETKTLATEWEPAINPLCGYCDYRRYCPAYAQAIESGHEIAKLDDPEKLDELAVLRENVAKHSKLLYARQEELNEVFKAKLKQDGEFDAGGYHYRFVSGGYDMTYDLEKVLRTLAEAGLSEVEMRGVLKVDNDALQGFVTKLEGRIGFSNYMLVKSTLESFVEQKPKTPKFDSRPLKKRPGKR
jgi:putative RecB family exonuclease